MKSVLSLIEILTMLPLIWGLSIPTLGQERQYRDPLQPDKGYWQIRTNTAANKTLIQFYDGKNQPLYQEEMAGKYIKLTERNIAKINQLFDQLAHKTIVGSQVASEPLSSPDFRKLVALNIKKQSLLEKENSTSPLNEATGLKVHAFQVHDTDKVHFNFRNPDQKRLIVNVLNEDGQTIYKEITSEINYNRSFDFKALRYGKYKLVVSPSKGRSRYLKHIEIKPAS